MLAYATAVVDVALILGPTTPAPLAVRILQWQNDPDLDLRLVAAAGAVLQIGVTGAAILVWLAAERALIILAGRLADYRLACASRCLAAPSRRRAHGRSPALVVLCGIALLALWSLAGPWRFPDFAAGLPHARGLDARPARLLPCRSATPCCSPPCRASRR